MRVLVTACCSQVYRTVVQGSRACLVSMCMECHETLPGSVIWSVRNYTESLGVGIN